MKIFVKMKDTVKEMDSGTLPEPPKHDLFGNWWVKIKEQWHPARKEQEKMDLDYIKYVGEEK